MSHDATFTARAVQNHIGFVPSFVSETAGGPVIRGGHKTGSQWHVKGGILLPTKQSNLLFFFFFTSRTVDLPRTSSINIEKILVCFATMFN